MASRFELSPANRIRHLVGKFNLTVFEKALINALLKSATLETAALIENQLAKFNRVRRVLQDDDRMECGKTTFYWHRFGKSRFDEFDHRLPYDDTSKVQVIGCCQVTDNEARRIEVKYHALMGVFNEMTFWSDDRVWYPAGEFEIRDVEIFDR